MGRVVTGSARVRLHARSDRLTPATASGSVSTTASLCALPRHRCGQGQAKSLAEGRRQPRSGRRPGHARQRVHCRGQDMAVVARTLCPHPCLQEMDVQRRAGPRSRLGSSSSLTLLRLSPDQRHCLSQEGLTLRRERLTGALVRRRARVKGLEAVPRKDRETLGRPDEAQPVGGGLRMGGSLDRGPSVNGRSVVRCRN
jgi:hypothetical protein